MKAGTKELLFFLTPDDLERVVDEFEIHQEALYYQINNSSNLLIESNAILKNLLHQPMPIGDWNHSPEYLISDFNINIVIEKIKLRKGGYSLSINQFDNPDSVVFKPSGFFDKNIIIAGSLTTISTTSWSLKVFNILSNIIKKESKRIKAFYVGPDAYSKLIAGWRLVTIASSPNEYDLRV